MDCAAAIIAAAQLTRYTVTNTAELTDCSWTDRVQGRAANQLTLCSTADCIAPGQQHADGQTNCSGLEGVHLC